MRNSVAQRLYILLVIALTCAVVAAPAYAQIAAKPAKSVEKVSAAKDLPPALQSVVGPGVRANLSGGQVVEIYPAIEIKGEKNGAENALYPYVPKGVFGGVIRFSKPATDYRGQKLAAGTYSLRYATLPGDGNHMGAAPSPDFFLLVRADSDATPNEVIPYRRLVSLSSKSCSTTHPAVLALDVAGETSPSVNTNEEAKTTAVTSEFNINAAKVPVAIIVEGQAQQ